MSERQGAVVGRGNRVAGRDYYERPVIVMTAPAALCAALAGFAALVCVAAGVWRPVPPRRSSRKKRRPRARA